MALPDTDQMRLLAKLKAGMRYTDKEVAAHFGVTPRTIQRWLKDTAYGEAVRLYREEQKESAKAQLSGIADDVITTLHTLMFTDRSGLVRFNAAKTLGEWIGMADQKEDKQVDNREEVVELMRRLAMDKPSPIYLPPPGAGGRLPDEFVEGEVVEEKAPTLDLESEVSADGEDLVGELFASAEKFSPDAPLDS